MAEAQETKYPKYVTDGFHIYLWNDEFASMLGDGRLKPAEAPPTPKAKALSPREKTKIEEMRKKALQDAENTVKVLKQDVDLDEIFGAPPKDSDEIKIDTD